MAAPRARSGATAPRARKTSALNPAGSGPGEEVHQDGRGAGPAAGRPDRRDGRQPLAGRLAGVPDPGEQLGHGGPDPGVLDGPHGRPPDLRVGGVEEAQDEPDGLRPGQAFGDPQHLQPGDLHDRRLARPGRQELGQGFERQRRDELVVDVRPDQGGPLVGREVGVAEEFGEGVGGRPGAEPTERRDGPGEVVRAAPLGQGEQGVDPRRPEFFQAPEVGVGQERVFPGRLVPLPGRDQDVGRPGGPEPTDGQGGRPADGRPVVGRGPHQGFLGPGVAGGGEPAEAVGRQPADIPRRVGEQPPVPLLGVGRPVGLQDAEGGRLGVRGQRPGREPLDYGVPPGRPPADEFVPGRRAGPTGPPPRAGKPVRRPAAGGAWPNYPCPGAGGPGRPACRPR